MPDKKEYGMLGEQFSEERWKLMAKAISPDSEVGKHYDHIRRQEGDFEAIIPIYPSWRIVEMNVGNLKDEHEEKACRWAMETAISAKNFGMSIFEIRKEKFDGIVKIEPKEPITSALVYSTSVTGKILVSGLDAQGKPQIFERDVENVPIFQMVKAEEGKRLEVFERQQWEKNIKEYLDMSPECWRLYDYAIGRIELTKSRRLAGIDAINQFGNNQRVTVQDSSNLPDENRPRGMLG